MKIKDYLIGIREELEKQYNRLFQEDSKKKLPF